MSPDWPVQTARLTLRPFVEDDLEAMHAIRSDPDVARYLYRGPFQTLEETRKFLEQRMASPAWLREGDWLSAAVVEDESGLTVGDVAFHWVSESDRTAEIGFVIDPRRQGKGYATEAAKALVDWAFAAGFHRVIGRTEARNAGSARVLEKLGMRREAHFVENEWVKGEWQSELVYAILDREWSG